MNTPVYDFIQKYIEAGKIRFHMPGHKGKDFPPLAPFDITEIEGADVLYHETGILKESQANAAQIFGTAKTLYSTEGSTLAIRGMLSLINSYALSQGKPTLIAAGRNAHRSFLTGCALLGIQPLWMKGEDETSIISLKISPKWLDHFLSRQEELPIAVYLTSPDYLGQILDIGGLSAVCKKHGVLLLVDNAHGSYLHFLPESHHPIAMGADLCCDSAHKTLSAFTGGAYLHISHSAPPFFVSEAENAMALFSSTSPSYLILSSLDRLNLELSQDFKKKLLKASEEVFHAKKNLRRMGFSLLGQEPMKICLAPKPFGYLGTEVADFLRKNGMEPEFSDPDYLVLMAGVENCEEEMARLLQVMQTLPPKQAILSFPPPLREQETVLTLREAIFSPAEEIPVSQAKGRILSSPGVTCPPAVSIAVCGERLNENAISLFQYYGINRIRVVKKSETI